MARACDLHGDVMVSVSGVFYGLEPGTKLRVNHVRMVAAELNSYWLKQRAIGRNGSTMLAVFEVKKEMSA